MNYPKLANCSADYVARGFKKLGGFINSQSAKHIKFTHEVNGRVFMLPRKSPLKRGLMWDMVRNYLEPLGYTESAIFKHLWC